MKRSRRNTTRMRRRRNRRTTTRMPIPIIKVSRGPWLSGLVAMVGLAGAGLGLHYGWEILRGANRLGVATIDARGTERATWAELQAYTGIAEGDPILDVDLDAAALGLRRHPWVKAATVRRRLPDGVVLEIEEHRPAILVAVDDVYLANDEGQIFKRLGPQDGIVLPLVTGISREMASTRPEQAEAVVRDAIALGRAVADTALVENLGEVEELHWDRDLGWSIICAPEVGPARTFHLGVDPVPRLDVAARAVVRALRMGRVPREVWADGTKGERVQLSFYQGRFSQNFKTLIAKAGE